MSSSTKTRVGITKQGTIVNHDITPVVGEFDPSLLCYLDGIEEVYMTKVCNVSPIDFVEILPSLSNLKVIVLDGCSQFHESHIVKICENNVSLQHIDVRNGTGLSFETVHYILGCLNDIFYLGFDPKHVDRVKDWQKMMRIFQYKNVEYGGRIVPVLNQ